MSATALKFELQFEPSEIPCLVESYKLRPGMFLEREALTAGKDIRSGARTRQNLIEIAEWKSPRRVRLLKDNTDDEITDALTLAISAQTDRSALAVLVGLDGVYIPMASAILTAIFPERFTIVDFRACEALGQPNMLITVSTFLHYLEFCRTKSRECRVTIRDFDRALWEWSKQRSERRKSNQ